MRSSVSKLKSDIIIAKTTLGIKEKSCKQTIKKIAKLENRKFTVKQLQNMISESVPKTQRWELILHLVAKDRDDIVPKILIQEAAQVEKLARECPVKAKNRRDFGRDLKETILLEVARISFVKQNLLNKHAKKFISADRRKYCRDCWFLLYTSYKLKLNKYEAQGIVSEHVTYADLPEAFAQTFIEYSQSPYVAGKWAEHPCEYDSSELKRKIKLAILCARDAAEMYRLTNGHCIMVTSLQYGGWGTYYKQSTHARWAGSLINSNDHETDAQLLIDIENKALPQIQKRFCNIEFIDQYGRFNEVEADIKWVVCCTILFSL